jgi:predicted amidohydrolase
MRIACVQHDIVWCDREANFAHLAPLISSAAGTGARLVLLTETFSTGFANGERIAEPTNGPSATFLVEAAARNGCWVGGSCAEVPDDAGGAGDADPRPANTFVLAGPDGTVHRYRKIHPFTYAGEHEHVRPGSELVTVDVEGVRCSLFVCYDLRFADEFWQLAPSTDAYLVVANWPASRRHHWQSLLTARAIENQAYVAAVNRVGSGGGLDYCGDSRIVDPLGETLASAAHTESIVIADIDPATVHDVRTRFPFLQDRR